MPILYHGIDRVAGKGPGAGGTFGDEPAVRIRERAMGGVAASLAAEVHRPIPRVLGPVRVLPILGVQPPLVFLGMRVTSRGTKLL